MKLSPATDPAQTIVDAVPFSARDAFDGLLRFLVIPLLIGFAIGAWIGAKIP